MDHFIGNTLLGYTILHEIGEGGMGKVYLAENQVIGQQVAIKILDPILARNPDLRERFAQEARIQVALQHQNIVRVLNAQSSDELSFLIMEYIEGQSLDKVLKRRGKLSVDESIKIFAQVLDAVGYAHDKGIIHRDLKPSNIMVCADGSTKVTDFGIAKVLGDTNLTRTGTSMGSPDYMSPEQVLGKKDIDHRTDIYSLGATLYEMLTGRPPFIIENGGTSDSDFLIKTAHVNQNPISPHELASGLDHKISSVGSGSKSNFNLEFVLRDKAYYKESLFL
jgi:serine/threonine-protein kinase